MKRIDGHIFTIFTAILAIIPQFWLTTISRAAGRDDGGGKALSNGVAELEAGTTVRYRVGYMKPRAGSVPRSATVVTVVNEANVPCTISVDWRLGFRRPASAVLSARRRLPIWRGASRLNSAPGRCRMASHPATPSARRN